MARPPAIKTFELTVGPGTSLILGDDLSITVNLTASRSAVWAATGTPLVAFLETLEAPAGQIGTARLPNPSQDGFTDEDGNPVRDWTYRADVQYKRAGRVVGNSSKVFTALEGDLELNLDSAIPVPSSAGVVVHVPDKWGATVALALEAAARSQSAAASSAASADRAAASVKPVADALAALKVELPKTYATPIKSRGIAKSGRGAIVLHLDDGMKEHYTIAAPRVEALGGRATFAIPGVTVTAPAPHNITNAQLLDLHNRGHELAAHSQTHLNMPPLTPAQRYAEWENVGTLLQGITGKYPTSFVYPYSAFSATTDKEGYLRYGRLFSGGVDTQYMTPSADRGKKLRTGRYAWTTTDHQRVLRLIRQASAQDMTLSIITHQIDGSTPNNGVTLAEFDEVLALIASLGMPIITAEEAFPYYLPVQSAGFELPSFTEDWTLNGANAANLLTRESITPAAGCQGTYSAKIVADGSAWLSFVSRYTIPIDRIEELTVSAQVRQDKASGAGGIYLALRWVDAFGANLSDSGSPIVTAVGLTDWVSKSFAATPPQNAAGVKIVLATSPFVGTAWFDHVHIGPTRLQVLN